MDLNELFFRHQIALMRADTASRAGECGERSRLQGLADALALRIGALHRRLGAPAIAPGAVQAAPCIAAHAA